MSRNTRDLLAAWDYAYYKILRDPKGRLFHSAWSQTMTLVLEAIAPKAVKPVVDALAGRGIRRLVLVPNRDLHAFPLHACPLANGRYLVDDYEVVYAPTLSILQLCAARRPPTPSRLLIVENPTCDLEFAEVEAAAVLRHFREHERLRGHSVRRSCLLVPTADCHVWHYTGHSLFNLGDPPSSALVLVHPEQREHWLTLRDIFAQLRLPQTTLAVLSGCESGGLRPDQLDDLVGLSSGFLSAGATCVISSLWNVDDLATTLLMDRFYREWLENKRNLGAALHEAQRWLRRDISSGPYLYEKVVTDEFLKRVLDDPVRREACRVIAKAKAKLYPSTPPYESPAYWAAFTAAGLTFPRPKLHEGCGASKVVVVPQPSRRMNQPSIKVVY